MKNFVHLKTVSDLLQFFQLEQKVEHPLIAVVDLSNANVHTNVGKKVFADFYSIIFKKCSKTNLKYGRKLVDFQEESLICIGPGQVLEIDSGLEEDDTVQGWDLFFHPNLIRGTSLGGKIREYGFFSYELSEALHLSEKEKGILRDCVSTIKSELKENIDLHSQKIIVSTIELLLNYCSRFYGRQFITRKSIENDTVIKMERLLEDYFNSDVVFDHGLPTVEYLAEQLHVSSRYLSDMLRTQTGQNAQQHIHDKLIEKAKYYLTSSNLSVSEIAWRLGFEHSQSFNKLFKKKTDLSPLKFRTSFN